MKFIDLLTGNTLETENEFSIAQYRNHPERYAEATTGAVEVEPSAESGPVKRTGGRAKKGTV